MFFQLKAEKEVVDDVGRRAGNEGGVPPAEEAEEEVEPAADHDGRVVVQRPRRRGQYLVAAQDRLDRKWRRNWK
jgi:hypothetical protein